MRALGNTEKNYQAPWFTDFSLKQHLNHLFSGLTLTASLFLLMLNCDEDQKQLRHCPFSPRPLLGLSDSPMLMDQSRRPNPNTTCHHPSLCYDRLIKQCLSCKHMKRGTRKETTTMLGTTSITTQPAQLPTGNQNCSALIFGFCAFVGLVIIMAMLLLVILKQRRKRMRKTGIENSKENGNCTSFLANETHTSHDCRPEDYDPGQLQCPHLNDVIKTTQDDVLKEIMPSIAFTRSQEFQVIPLCPHDEKCNSPFPLPATELGATVLVTTKTIQENVFSEDMP